MIVKETNEYMHFFRTDHIKITSETTIPWTLDGEFGGDLKTADIWNHKQALAVIVPE
jgi:diacylglycerol kinase family enzyme